MSVKAADPGHHLTKIVATLGPASDNREMIRELADAGADLFRLNFSHGSHEQHERTMGFIREVEREIDRPIGVIADLQGPKLRVGCVPKDGIELSEGDQLALHLEECEGGPGSCQLPHPEIFAAAEPDTDLLLDDGNLRLRITAVDGKVITTEVLVGGLLKPRKGVNYPGRELPIAALTDKDREDLSFALGIGADWVALSFVQREQDLIEARSLIDGKARLIAKIEKPLAVKNLDSLIVHCDAIMIARGDLGVETPLEEVPALQKRMILKCRRASKPVIVATQMLESMTSNPTPTRAEASDVATALYDGADAVMLSAESASGAHPQRAVEYMRRIIRSTESDPEHQISMHRDSIKTATDSPSAIVAAACTVANAVDAVAIVSFSKTGNTTLRASRLRPNCALLGLTPLVETARASTLYWGVRASVGEDLNTTAEMVQKATEVVTKYGFASQGDSIVVTAGLPLGVPGRTNVLRLAVVGEDQ